MDSLKTGARTGGIACPTKKTRRCARGNQNSKRVESVSAVIIGSWVIDRHDVAAQGFEAERKVAVATTDVEHVRPWTIPLVDSRPNIPLYLLKL